MNTGFFFRLTNWYYHTTC